MLRVCEYNNNGKSIMMSLVILHLFQAYPFGLTYGLNMIKYALKLVCFIFYRVKTTGSATEQLLSQRVRFGARILSRYHKFYLP